MSSPERPSRSRSTPPLTAFPTTFFHGKNPPFFGCPRFPASWSVNRLISRFSRIAVDTAMYKEKRDPFNLVLALFNSTPGTSFFLVPNFPCWCFSYPTFLESKCNPSPLFTPMDSVMPDSGAWFSPCSLPCGSCDVWLLQVCAIVEFSRTSFLLYCPFPTGSTICLPGSSCHSLRVSEGPAPPRSHARSPISLTSRCRCSLPQVEPVQAIGVVFCRPLASVLDSPPFAWRFVFFFFSFLWWRILFP